jgi:hypothetical protein
MTHDEGSMITPREYDYWKSIYRELVLLPDWSELEVLREENDEWTARAESFANIRLLCGICYDSARELNFPTWRQFFPGSA